MERYENVMDARQLADLAARLSREGWRVIVPAADGEVVRLMEWRDGMALELSRVPVNSAKDFLLPRSEVIGRASLQGDDFTVEHVEPQAARTVLLGIRPCDAASLAAMDAVFHWDYDDAFYAARRDGTAIVPIVCTAADEQCFCTSVGGAPDGTDGADAMLRPADGGSRFILEPRTPRAEALMGAARHVAVAGDAQADAPVQVPVRFDAQGVTDWLARNFDSDLWRTWSLACLGCGACAYTCPTCHCFDIQDEATRERSVRYRNWDACGFGLFTVHTSGHNPRADQSARWRQRVMHKFSYYPQKFGRLACTGCGRCARACANGMAIAAVCEAIDALRRQT